MAAYQGARMRPARSALVWWTVLVTLSVAVAYGIVYVRNVADDIAQYKADNASLAEQVRSLGGIPTAGPKGDSGHDGARGADGDDGSPGRDGSDGDDGRDGAPGPTGSPGPVGQEGADGAAGKDGAAGPEGPTGPVGPSGPAGPQGEKGEKGDRGDVGESVMCPDGFTPTEVFWLGDHYMWCKKEES